MPDMHRFTSLLLFLAALWLPGCAAMTAVSAVPGALFEVVATQFGGEEESFPRNIRPTLAAMQLGLRSMKLDADVLEIQDDGYTVAFSNGKLNGVIRLEKMTPRLTTVHVKVRGNMREASVERAIIKSVRTKLNRMEGKQRFRFAGYHNLRAKPDVKTARLGWCRPQAKLDIRRNGKSDWLRLKLPSGKIAYLKGNAMKLAKM